MDRRTARFLGAALLVTSAAIGLTAVADAGQVRVGGSLLGLGREMTVLDCGTAFDGDAVAVATVDRFDPATSVSVSTADPAGWTTGGGHVAVGEAALVHVHVPAGSPSGSHVVEVKAAGYRHGLPAEVIDRLTVRVRC